MSAESVCEFCEYSVELARVSTDFSNEAIAYYQASVFKPELITQRLDQLVALWSFGDGAKTGILYGTPPEGGVATIVWLLVDPKFQGEGIGAQLYQEAVLRYKEMGAHKIKLNTPSERAARFYERVGMKLEGFHPAHWWKADSWSMGMELE